MDQKELYLEIVEPVVPYRDVQRPARKAPSRPSALTGHTVALVPNFKLISPPFMEVLAERLARQTTVARAFMHNPDWQFTHPGRAGKIGPEIDALAQQCNLMVSGVGD